MRHAVRWTITALSVLAALIVTVTGQEYYRSGGGGSVTSPATIAVVQGGVGTTSTLTLQPTSGAGTTGADIIFKGGNNGATEFGRWLNSGVFQLSGTTPEIDWTPTAGTAFRLFPGVPSDSMQFSPATANKSITWIVVPSNASATFSQLQMYGTSDTTTNYQRLELAADAANSEISLVSRKAGTGTQLPIDFYIQGGSKTLAMSVNTDATVTAPVASIAPLFRSTTAKLLVQGTGTGATQLATTQTTPPTCSTNCGTSPSVTGTDTFMTVTMGATGSPASGWVVTFNGTWAAAPACTVNMALAGMVVGKMPLTVATTTTTITVVTNGTAPSTSDKYHIHCGGTQ